MKFIVSMALALTGTAPAQNTTFTISAFAAYPSITIVSALTTVCGAATVLTQNGNYYTHTCVLLPSPSPSQVTLHDVRRSPNNHSDKHKRHHCLRFVPHYNSSFRSSTKHSLRNLLCRWSRRVHSFVSKRSYGYRDATEFSTGVSVYQRRWGLVR
jgi:hypothetical protein